MRYEYLCICSYFKKKYKDIKIKKAKTGSAEPTLCTITHLAGRIKNKKERNRGLDVNLKSLTKK